MTNNNNELDPYVLSNMIMTIRGQKVILAQDLARLFGVETKRLNEQVKRNIDRFPEDFMFQLKEQEVRRIAVANCDRNFKMMRTLPYVFTEHGAVMAANVLNSPQAIKMSIYIVRAFVAMRQMSGHLQELADKLDELDRKYIQHDEILKLVGEILFPAELPASTIPQPTKKKIGFINRKK